MNGKLLSIPVVVLAAMAIVAPAISYFQNTYPVQQAETYCWEASSSTNLTQMGNYIEKALDLLDPYSGNPVWFMPKPDTDWGNIKSNMRTTAAQCHAFDDVSPTNMSYQLAITAMQQVTAEIADHLAASPSAGVSIQAFTTWNPTVVWLDVLFGGLGLLLGLVAFSKWDD